MHTEEEAKEYLLVKGGLYYRPNNCGYTGIKRQAGRYIQSEECIEDGVVAVHQDAAADCSDACYSDYRLAEFERNLALSQTLAFAEIEGVTREMIVDYINGQLVSDQPLGMYETDRSLAGKP